MFQRRRPPNAKEGPLTPGDRAGAWIPRADDGTTPGAAAPLDNLLHATRQLCRWAAWFGGFLFILASFLITVEIILRKAFNASIGGADELTGYALATAASWSFGFAVLERAHIRVDTFYVALPARLRAVLDVVAVAAMLLFFWLILYYGFIMFADSVRIGTRSRTGLYIPLMIPQSIWLLGLVISVTVTAILLLRTVVALALGDIRTVTQIAGSKSAYHELEEELAALDEQRTSEETRDGSAGTGRHSR